MNDNTGHGHVWERPDGKKTRCGGPGLCAVCFEEAQRHKAATIKVGSIVQHTGIPDLNGKVTHIVRETGVFSLNNSRGYPLHMFRLTKHGEHVIVPGETAPSELYDGQTLVIAGTHSLCVDTREARQWVPVRRSDVIAWRDEWLDNNPPHEQPDNVTPFDQYLYSK